MVTNPDASSDTSASENRVDQNRDDSTQLGRRGFLRAGVLGIAGSLAGGGGMAAAADTTKLTPFKSTAQSPGAAAPHLQDKPVNVVQGGAPETWNEPWVWRPSDWPGQQLDLNVVENQNPGIPVGLGNPGSVLFSYGGNTPGPTIRMKGDETLFVKLRNQLGQDFGDTFVSSFPHETPTTGGTGPDTILDAARAKAIALGNYRADFCLGEHTHGLHVRPSRNPNGTHSDNVILRVLNQADFRRREQEGAKATEVTEASCLFLRNPQELYFLRDDEVTGQADYEFRLGNEDLYQLSIDGVTLVKDQNGKPKYFIKPLSKQGIKPGTSGNSPDDMLPNPLWSYDPRCARKLHQQLNSRNQTIRQGADLMCRLQNVWANPANVKNCFVRWNEFYMGPANRTDLFFQAPALSKDSPARTVTNADGTATTYRYDVYTVLAKTVVVHSDTPQFVAQSKVQGNPPALDGLDLDFAQPGTRCFPLALSRLCGRLCTPLSHPAARGQRHDARD